MKKLQFIILFFLITPICVTNAQVKVAHIEVQKLISEMPEVIAAQKELEKLEKSYTAEMENTYKEFQTKAQTYAADAANQTDITNQARQKELETMQQNIQQYQQTVAQDLQKKQADMMRRYCRAASHLALEWPETLIIGSEHRPKVNIDELPKGVKLSNRHAR